MKCPVCVAPDLMMTERQGIEIDYCPMCRGIWLDRGELDKIVERAAPSDSRAQRASRHANDEGYWNGAAGHDEYRRDREKRKKRGGLLSDLFDFD